MNRNCKVSLFSYFSIGLLWAIIGFAQPAAAQITPTITTSGSPLSYVKVNDGQEVDPGLTITGTAITWVTSATVSISNAQPGDELIYANGGNVNGTFTGTTLNLTSVGNVNKEAFQARLRTVKFKAGSGGNPSTAQRTITYSINISANSTNPATLGLYGTGVNAAGNALVTANTQAYHWTVQGPGMANPVATYREIHEAYKWPDNTTAPVSAWVSTQGGTGTPGAAVGNFLFRLNVNLTNIDPASVVIQGRWSSDNQSTGIQVNGGATGQSGSQLSVNPGGSFILNSGNSNFVAGSNTLTFNVHNDGSGTPPANAPNPMGTQVRFTSVSATGSASATRTIHVAPIAASQSNVSLTPSTVIADGDAFSTVTVTVKNAAGTGISGLSSDAFDIGFYVGGSSSSTAIYDNFQETGNGIYTFRLKNTVAEAGTVQVKVKDISLNQQPSLTFQAGPPDDGQSSVEIDPDAIPANGTSTATVTVTLKDANANPVSGTSVFLVTDGGTLNGNTFTTNASGQITVTLTSSTTAQTAMITAYLGTDDTGGEFGMASIEFTVGSASRLAFFTEPIGAASGEFLATQPVIHVVDEYGNLITDATNEITLSISNNPASGTLSGTTSITAINGVATFNNLSIDKASAGYTLLAETDGLSSAVSNTFEITLGSASQLSITTQPSASAQSNIAFLQQPVIQLLDAGGNAVPQPDIEVTVAVSNDGTLMGTATAITDANGTATFTGLGISDLVGTYHLIFNSLGLSAAISDDIVLSAGPATALVITTQPVGGASGSVLGVQPVVHIVDAQGNLVTGDGTTEVTVSIASGDDGVLGGPQTVTADAGIATFSGLTLSGLVREIYTFDFDADDLTGITSANVTLSGSGPADPSRTEAQVPNGTSGEETLITVTVEDAQGNPVIGVAGDLAGTVSGDNTASLSFVAGAVDGTYTATYTPTTAGTDEIAITRDGDAIPDSPFESEITAGAAAHIYIETQSNGSGVTVPAGGLVSGEDLVVYAISRDAHDNFVGLVEDATWSLTSVTGGIVSGDLTPNTGGSATFTAAKIGTARISASSGSLNSTPSGVLTVTASPVAARLVLTGDNADLPSGDQIEFTITVQDAAGNTVAPGEHSALDINLEQTGTGDIGGPPALTGTTVNGILVLSPTGHNSGQVSVQAKSVDPLLESNEFIFNVVPGAAAHIHVIALDVNAGVGGELVQEATAGVPFAVRVYFVDATGNKITDLNETFYVAWETDATASPSGTSPSLPANGPQSFVNGALQLTGVVLYNAESLRDIKVSLFDESPTDLLYESWLDLKLNVFPNIAHAGQSTIEASPAIDVVVSDVGGSTITTTIRDAYGNIRTSGEDKVFMGYTAGGVGGGGLWPQGLQTTDTNGQVSALLNSTNANEVEVTAYLGVDDLAEEIGEATVMFVAADPAQIYISDGDNESAIVGTAVTEHLVVWVLDEYNNPVKDVDVTFEVATGEGSLSGTTTVTTDANGYAGYAGGGWTLGTTAGPNTVKATIVGSDPAIQVTFTATGIHSTLSGFEVSSTSESEIADQVAGTPFDIRIRAVDIHGNTVSSFVGTVNLTTTSVFSAGGGTTAAFTAGLLSAHSLTLSEAGTNLTITATNTGGSENGISNEFDVIAGASAQLVFVEQPPASTVYGNDFATNIVVHIQDENDNLVLTPGNNVTLSITDNVTGAVIVGTTTVEAVDGVATFSGLSVNQAGEFTLTATFGVLEVESNEFDITAKTLVVSGVTAEDKIYDGNMAATLDVSDAALIGLVGSDEVELSTPVGTFAQSAAGEDITVTAALSLTGSASGNYILTQPADLEADITAKSLTVSGVTAEDKIYDGNTAATLDVSGAVLTDLVGSDEVELSTPVGTFAQSAAGEDITVTAALSLTGSASGNYILTQPADLEADITAKTVTVTLDADPLISKIYDNNVTATLVPDNYVLHDVVSGDEVFVSGTAVYDNKSVGTGKQITVNEFSLSGADAGNYNLTTISATTVGNIIAGTAVGSGTTAVVPDGTAGEITTIIITAKDAYGNPVGVGGADVSVVITGANPQSLMATDNDDGTYTVTYTPTVAGTDHITISLDEVEIDGSSYESVVSHGTLAEIVFTGNTGDLASGTSRELAVTLYDNYDNIIVSGPQSTLNVSFVQLSGTGSVSGLGIVAAVNGIAELSVLGEKGGHVTLLAAITSPELTSNYLSITVSVDKEDLQDAVDTAELLTETDYSPASWSALETALTAAQDVLDDPSATQSEIDAAEQNLRDVMDALTVDKEDLQDAVDIAESLTETDYSPASWTALETALTAAQDVLDDPSATQSDIDAAEQDLRDAIDNLTVDKEDLQNAVDIAESLTETDYSPASWSALEAALTAAQDVLDDPSATQSEIDAAEQNLRDAMDALNTGDSLSAPRNIAAKAGDKEIVLTWSAPLNTGGAPITDYIIEYSIDQGLTWQTYQNGISVVTNATMTGMINNIPHLVRVAAVNAAGIGTFSNAAGPVIPTAPVPDTDHELPEPLPGEAILLIDGVPHTVTIEVIERQTLRLRGSDFEMDVISIDHNGQIIPIDDTDAIIRIIRGDEVTIQVKGHGFEPGTVVTLYMFSTVHLLGHIPVLADGTFEGTVLIPSDVELGYHTLQANGIVRDSREERSVSLGILVVEQLDQQITFAPLPTTTYGDAPLTLQGSASSGLPVSYRITDAEGNNTDIATIVDGQYLQINGAGTVRVIASQVGGGIYGPAGDVINTLVIKPATLIVSVLPVTRPYGQSNPSFSLQYTGFVGEDSEQSLSQKPVAGTVAKADSDVGVYPLTITGGQSVNYVFQYTASTLTVERAQQTINFVSPGELDRQAGRVTLNVSATSGLPVTLTVNDPQVGIIDGQALEVLRLGTITITANQEGSVNYYPADPVSVTIRIVDNSEFPIRVHQAVSPNGDGINEFLMVEGIRDFFDNRMTIINRNGTILWQASGYDNGQVRFQGISSSGQRLPAGTYFYILEIKDNGTWRTQKGYFVLRY